MKNNLWHQETLADHYNRHPCVEPCWEERAGHPISLEEYEDQSDRTIDRAKIELLSTTSKYDNFARAAFDERPALQFVDGMVFTTVVDEMSGRIKTHFHIHKGGKKTPHMTGSTKLDFQLQLDDFLEMIERKERCGEF